MLTTRGNALLVLAMGALFWSSAQADVVIRLDDDVYVHGKTYTREEWEKIKDDPQARALRESPTPVQPAAVKREEPAPAQTIAGLRAASCKTTRMYDEFPDGSEKFACSDDLGSLTREEILQRGWKIDLIEKLPAAAGAPSTSARGLPLNSYKLILSR